MHTHSFLASPLSGRLAVRYVAILCQPFIFGHTLAWFGLLTHDVGKELLYTSLAAIIEFVRFLSGFFLGHRCMYVKNIYSRRCCDWFECLRKYVFKKLLLQKLSRRQYLRYIFYKRAKVYFIEGRFWSKVAVYFVSLFHWPTTHRAFVRGRTPLQCPIVPETNRTGQTGQAPLFVQQQHKQWTHGGLRG